MHEWFHVKQEIVAFLSFKKRRALRPRPKFLKELTLAAYQFWILQKRLGPQDVLLGVGHWVWISRYKIYTAVN